MIAIEIVKLPSPFTVQARCTGSLTHSLIRLTTKLHMPFTSGVTIARHARACFSVQLLECYTLLADRWSRAWPYDLHSNFLAQRRIDHVTYFVDVFWMSCGHWIGSNIVIWISCHSQKGDTKLKLFPNTALKMFENTFISFNKYRGSWDI